MTIDRGARLGHYEILEPIGAGGMGEVYKATDTRLDRVVAVKVLASHLAESPERKERFEREARLVSQLNHPNICTLHDIGSQNGTDFLVMEYLEGETLADRLKRGPLSNREALDYAVQITDALTKAHRAGIVHRDLKPANIMRTKTGVKLLDFGLAKLVETDPAPDHSDAPTVQRNLTQERAVVGTPRYMAPEQLEGGQVDARTDLYAFGLVLREMLTGKKSDAVIESKEIERAVSKCLLQDPDERWQTAKDLGDELRWLATKPRDESQASAKASMAPVVVFLSAAMLASVAWWALRGAEPEAPRAPTHFRMDVPENGFLLNEYSNPFAISRDGARVVLRAYGDNGIPHLFLRSMNVVDATEVSGTEGGSVPVFSWDGESIAFSISGEIRRLELSGGVPVKVSDRPRLSSGAAWGPDDTVVLSASELLRVPAAGGVMEPLLALEDGQARWPQFLPDGKTLLFTRRTGDEHRPALLSLQSGEHRIFDQLGVGRGARYVPPGYIVWCEGTQLFAARFDLKRLEVLGSSVPVLDGVYTAPDSNLAYFTTADNGTLLYLTVSGASFDWRLVLVDRSGVSTALFEERGYFRFPRFSPDGRKVAVGRRAETGTWDLWVYDMDTGTRDRVATDTDGSLVWSPDGNRIAFTNLYSRSSIFMKTVGGELEERPLSSTHRPFVRSWAPDGSAGLAIFEMHPDNQADIVVLNEDGSATPWLATDDHETVPEFSPDGKWIAYVSDETDRAEVYVRPYPGPGQKVPISTGGGRDPIWSPDGSELFYRNGRAVMVVSIEREPSFRPSRPEQLFTGPYGSRLDSASASQAWYDISPDGENFVMIETTSTERDVELHVILNWDEELNRLVPTEK